MKQKSHKGAILFEWACLEASGKFCLHPLKYRSSPLTDYAQDVSFANKSIFMHWWQYWQLSIY
jgi:hypothetical protein